MSENQIEILGNREVELLDKQRKINLQKLFTQEGMDLIISEIEKEVATFSADISTKEGRAKIVSMAAKIAKCKSPIEKLAKEAKDESQKIIAGIQYEWKRYEAKMDLLRDTIRKPVDDIEEAEAKQLQERQKQLALIEQYRNANFANSPSMYEDSIKQIRQLMQFDWGDDWIFKAETAANEIIAILEEKVEAAKKYQADQAELAQLKKEKEEREQKDREEQIRKDAEEKARKDEEDARKKAEEDKRVAEEKLVIEARKTFLIGLGFVQDVMTGDFIFKGSKSYAKIAGREFLMKDGEAWSRTMIQAQEFAKNIIKENEEFAKAEEKRIADEAIEKERKRQEDEKEAERLATEKREKNKRHRTKIENEIVKAIDSYLRKEAILIEPIQNELIARIIFEMLEKGEVPHVQINY